MKQARIVLLLLLFALGGCAGQIPARPLPGAAVVYPGFDTGRYPGDAVLRTWRDRSPYHWVGYYLASPCHRDASWMGKRETLERLGWGVGILYVGQQAFEGEPLENPDAEAILCSRTLLGPEQGRQDARDAIGKAAAESFAAGSAIYLDVERMEQIPPEMLAYLRAWVAELLADGRYRPGIYVHRINAAELHTAAAEAYREARRKDEPPVWVAGGADFALDRPPQAVGLPFADVWQGAFDVERTWAGATLQVDENVAARPSPSAPPER